MKTSHVSVTIKVDGRQFTRIHLVDPTIDTTLCGIALEGDSTTGLGVAIDSYKPIDCERCVRIIDHCNGVKKDAIKRHS